MGKKKFYGSLVRRIVLVFLLLVVLPLGIHAILVWDRDYKQRLDTAFSELSLLAKANEEIFEGWFYRGMDLLETFAYLTDDEADLSRRFEDSKVYGNFSTIFTLDSSFETDCSTSGKVDFPKSILQEAYAKGQLAFLATSPKTGKPEVVLVKRIDDTLWGLSVDAEKWLKDTGIYLSFVEPATRIDEDTMVLTKDQLENWEERFTFFEILDFKEKDFALRLRLKDVLFDLQTTLTAEKISAYARVSFLNHMILLFALIVVIGGLGAWWLITRLSRPLSHLYEVMEGVASGDVNRRYQKSRFGFELNTLGVEFNQMLSSLLLHMEIAKKERVARELLLRELEIGREVQDHLLPKELPEFPGLAIGRGFVPAKEVGGDFYDLFVKDQNHLFLAIADASDKGVSACLYSLIVRSMLRSHILSGGSLGAIARDVNELFCRDTKASGEFVTAWVGTYRAEDHLLTYTNLGHLPGLLFHPNGEMEELTTDGIALGVTDKAGIEVKVERLVPGSLLFLYTDGITEAQNEKGELFGKSRLLEFLQGHRAKEPQELIDLLIEEISRFSNDAAQHDDQTVLCLKVY